ncbi:6138_t:CDS:2, partial [Paraglomus occultum]
YMGFNERWIKLIMMGVKALRRQSLKDKILGINKDCKDIVEEDEIEDLEDEDIDLKSEDESVSPLSTEDKTFIQSQFMKLQDEIRIDLDQQNTVDASTDPQSHSGITEPCLPLPNSGDSVQRFSWSYIFSRPFSLSRILTGLWLLKREVMEKIPQHRFSQGFAVGGFVVWAWMRVSQTARNW